MHWKQFLLWLSKGIQEPRPYDDADWYEVRIGTDALRHLLASPVGILNPTEYKQATLWHVYQERAVQARLDDPMPGIARRMAWSSQVSVFGNQ